MLTYKLLGMLMSYPSGDLQKSIPGMKNAIKDDGVLSEKTTKRLFVFMDTIEQRNLLTLQQDYVALFDRSRAHSLYLFEHVHGESRDRGQAMVDLLSLYKSHGFQLSQRELPDYLPLFMEFLSLLPFDEAQEHLGEAVHIIAAIGAKLKRKKSGYSAVFQALECLSAVEPDERFIKQALKDDENEDTSLEALDQEWEEAPAFDGLGAAACGVCPQTSQHAARQTGANKDT